MYQMELSRSLFPAQTDGELLDTTVGGVLRSVAADYPDQPALHEMDGGGRLGRSWTYAELLADCERLAHALLTRYQPGERIAVWAPNVPEWVLAEFAFGMAGLVLVTVNPGYQARELRHVLNQSGAVGLFLVSHHRGNPMAEIAESVTRDIPAIREIVDLTDADALHRAAGPPQELPRVDPRDPAQIQYTSGSTGSPKGVLLHHHGITNNSRLCYLRGGAPPLSTTLVHLPLFHTGGCVGAVLGPVQFGCRIILARQFVPDHITAVVESERVAYMISVPTTLQAILEADAVHPRDLSSLQLIGVGGSTVSPALVRDVTARFGSFLFTCYGQTEASPLLTVTRPDDSFDDICETAGQPLPHTELAIMDPIGKTVLPLGAVGEICARGYGVMLGYHDDPLATAETIDGEGWLHTGDLGTMDARGFVTVTGRVKEMIIRGGENIFPAEIEIVILEHGDVAEVAVVGVPDDRLGEAVAAFVRMKDGVRLDRAALVAHVRANLAAQKTPAHWTQVDDWPMTGSGKIQKFQLRQEFVNGLSTGPDQASSSAARVHALDRPPMLRTDYEFCRVETRGHVLEVTIDRPEACNALHPPAHAELADIFDAFDADRDLWVAILTGAGTTSFSAGNDLKWAASGKPVRFPPTGFAGLTSRPHREKPLISAVNGFAMGGGFEICLASDLVVADAAAQFALSEVKVGLIAGAGGLVRLPRQIPEKIATEYILTGAAMSADEALHWGLVNRVVPTGTALASARELADRIMSGSPTSVRLSLRAMRRAAGHGDPVEAIRSQVDILEELLASDDAREGAIAFAERRPAQWRNQ